MPANVYVFEKEYMEQDIIKNLDIEIDTYKKQWQLSHNNIYLDTIERLQNIKHKLLKGANHNWRE